MHSWADTASGPEHAITAALATIHRASSRGLAALGQKRARPSASQRLRKGRRMKVKLALDVLPLVCESWSWASVDDELKSGPGGLDLPRCLAA